MSTVRATTILQILIVVFAILFITMLLLTGACLLVIHKEILGNDSLSFLGGVFGSLIAGIITLLALYLTLRNNNKKQLELANLQSAIQVENSYNESMYRERELLTRAFSQLQSFTLVIKTIRTSQGNYMSDRKYIHEMYSSFRQAINTVKIETQIYYDYTKCVDCNKCNSLYFSKLAELTVEIKNLLENLEKECSMAIIYMTQALDTGFNIENLLETKQSSKKYYNSLNQLIVSTKNILEKYHPDHPEYSAYTHSLNEYELQSLQTSKELLEYDELINKRVTELDTLNKKARQQALDIERKYIGSLLFNLQVYFNIFNQRIAESREQVTEAGRVRIAKISQCHDNANNLAEVKKINNSSFYYAIIRINEDKTHSITMPDFPELHFEIEILDSLEQQAQQAVELWIQNNNFSPQPPLTMESAIVLEEAKLNSLLLVQINFDFMENTKDTTQKL